MEEKDLIPYEAAEIRAERVLALAAHPDDEVLGAAGLLAFFAESAEAVRVVVLTGGEAQEERGEGSSDPDIRRREAREAGAELGITDYVFENLPDRALSGRKRDLAKLLRDHVSSFRPDAIVLPSPCEIHPDHRAVAEAGYGLVAGMRAADAEFESYRLLRLVFYEVTQPILPNALVPLGPRAEKKARAVGKFVSQAAVRDYGGAIAGLNAFRSLTLSGGAGPAEAFRVISARDAAVTPLAELRRAIGPASIAAGSHPDGARGRRRSDEESPRAARGGARESRRPDRKAPKRRRRQRRWGSRRTASLPLRIGILGAAGDA